MSAPTVAIIIPRKAEISPFATSVPVKADTILTASSMSMKYSGGPKRSARLLNGRASSVKPMMPMVPAMKEAIAAIAKAAPARPLRAMGWPSRVVIADEAEPGVLRSTDEAVPPYIPP
jgi:hypothetical protein